MKIIIKKFKQILFISICIFINNSILAIDPVEIGTKYQNDIDVNLSIIENLNQNKEEKIKIDRYKNENKKKSKRRR